MAAPLQPARARPRAPYCDMPTPWPHPRPVNLKTVACGSCCAVAGAAGPAGTASDGERGADEGDGK